MIRFGCHAFVYVGEWNTESGNHAIRQVGAAGFDLIEIPLLHPAAFDAASHRAALDAAGISGACSLALPREVHMPVYPDKARTFLLAALDKVAELGSDFLGGCLTYNLGTLTGVPPTDAERAIVVDVMREIAAAAKARGITLGMEPCNRYETYMYNTLEDMRDCIHAIGADNVILHADTYHMNIEEAGLYDPILATADVLRYVHMSESHRGLVGSGNVNWGEIWRGLTAIQFNGTLTLESFAAINPDLTAATCLWRPPRQSSGQIAEDGLAFLKAGAAAAGLL
jgi:D-psicose/D-tagatose/L-ribulose 3-epimerase